MRLDSAHLDHARKVADAILYEGYLLYPYRQSSQKNKVRFQFGVLMPPAYRAIDDCEPSASQTECLIECADDAEIRILVRFLQLQRRSVYGISPETGALHQVGTLYVDGSEFTGWDEAAEREQHLTASVAALLSRDRNLEFHAGSGETVEDLTDSQGRMAGRLVRQWDGIDGTISVHAERVAGPYQALRLRVRVENHTVPGTELQRREDGLRHALIAAHSLIGVPGGTFLSMTDCGLRQHRDLARAGRAGGLHRPDAVFPGHPLRPSRDRPGKRRRPLRCHRDRRDPDPPHDGADRVGEARGARIGSARR
jgi:hypothetical protein